MKRALFIGRFQPFHLGHLSVLEQAYISGYDEVIIGIGSSQYSRMVDNPFTYDERVDIIKASITNNDSIPKVHFVALPDIHDDSRWVEHVNAIMKDYTLSYDAVFTGNAVVHTLFADTGTAIIPIEPTIDINSTLIREYIRTHNPTWKDFIHPNAQTLVTQNAILTDAGVE